MNKKVVTFSVVFLAACIVWLGLRRPANKENSGPLLQDDAQSGETAAANGVQKQPTKLRDSNSKERFVGAAAMNRNDQSASDFSTNLCKLVDISSLSGLDRNTGKIREEKRLRNSLESCQSMQKEILEIVKTNDVPMKVEGQGGVYSATFNNDPGNTFYSFTLSLDDEQFLQTQKRELDSRKVLASLR